MSKNHRQNHDFQIACFLAGKCHTPDGAYSLLCDLKEDRQAAIANYHVNEKRSLAKKLRTKALLESSDAASRMDAEADLDEIETARKAGRVLFDAASDELAFIDKCIAALQPHRKYAALSDPQAHEAMQQEEWKFELLYRAENYLLCSGTIPPDEFSTMRSHPEFAGVIYPAIMLIRAAMQNPDSLPAVLAQRGSCDIQKLISTQESSP